MVAPDADILVMIAMMAMMAMVTMLGLVTMMQITAMMTFWLDTGAREFHIRFYWAYGTPRAWCRRRVCPVFSCVCRGAVGGGPLLL